jgi:hypothetical protein
MYPAYTLIPATQNELKTDIRDSHVESGLCSPQYGGILKMKEDKQVENLRNRKRICYPPNT